MTTWDEASAGIGNVSAKCRSIAREVFDAAQNAGHDIWFMWGDGSQPDHVYNRPPKNCPVLDFMVRNKRAGDWVRDYIWAHRERLGLRHVIWWQHITSTVVQPGVVRKMADRGSPTKNHFDHNHAEFKAGEYIPLLPPAPEPPAVTVRKGTAMLVYKHEKDDRWALAGAGTGQTNWVEVSGKPATGLAQQWAANTVSGKWIVLDQGTWDLLRRLHTGTAA